MQYFDTAISARPFRQIATHISGIPEASRDVPCTIGHEATVSLSYVALDYVGHLEHHLGQIFATT